MLFKLFTPSLMNFHQLKTPKKKQKQRDENPFGSLGRGGSVE